MELNSSPNGSILYSFMWALLYRKYLLLKLAKCRIWAIFRVALLLMSLSK